MTRLPAYLGGHGYFPAGLPELQVAIAAMYADRGLPTDPEQVMVTPGALSGVSIVAQALTGRGDRVLVDTPATPTPPSACAARAAGSRPPRSTRTAGTSTPRSPGSARSPPGSPT